ncbi:MAG: 4Fe-4S dicluster domain-containing protein [Clostridia bacterium]|nr:4Fe-4S dicluster domain-containing protein [Clostridia bacterium]
MKRLSFDPARCSLCGACALACSLSRCGRPEPAESRIRIECAGPDEPLRSAVCAHCEQPACVSACMRGIIEKDEKSGLVTRRWENCFACGACAVYCPVGASSQEPSKKAFTACDLCGGDPLCVAVCPSGALRFEEDAEGSARRRSAYAGRFFGSGGDKAQERPGLPSQADWERIASAVGGRLGVAVDPESLADACSRQRKAWEEEGM